MTEIARIPQLDGWWSVEGNLTTEAVRQVRQVLETLPPTARDLVVVDGITLRWHPKALSGPEGCRPVWVSEGLIEALGGGRVEWGAPDADGFYTPVVHQAWLSADELVKVIDGWLTEESPEVWSRTTSKIAHGLALAIVATLRGPAVDIPRGIDPR